MTGSKFKSISRRLCPFPVCGIGDLNSLERLSIPHDPDLPHVFDPSVLEDLLDLNFSGKPLPLPLPPDQIQISNLELPPNPKPALHCKSQHFSAPRFSTLDMDRSKLRPLPVAPEGKQLNFFAFDYLSSVCNNFSAECCIRESNIGSVYKCCLNYGDDPNTKIEAELLCFKADYHTDYENWAKTVKSAATLNHPNLCKLIGFCAEELDQCAKKTRIQILVYEHCEKGALGKILETKIPPLSWCTRIAIALGAAKALKYLHDTVTFSVPYIDFNTSNILVDSNFNAKLTHYCFQSNTDIPPTDILKDIMLKEDTSVRDNVRCFGLVLLELLTGGLSRGGEDLIQYIVHFLKDESKLFLIVDHELEGQCSIKQIKIVARLIQHCLHKYPSQRPSMRFIIDILSMLQGSTPHDRE